MSDTTLLCGPYFPPVTSVGELIVTDDTGEIVTVTSFNDGPMKWPTYSKRKFGSGKRSPVVTGDLSRALRNESVAAVQFNFGFSKRILRQIRRDLGVSRINRDSHAENEIRRRDTQLLSGPYLAPATFLGALMVTDDTGEVVTVTSFTKGLIQWPRYSNQPLGGGNPRPVVTGDLSRAVTDESMQAVEFYFGISRKMIREIKRALGVPAFNAGSKALAARNSSRNFAKVWPAMLAGRTAETDAQCLAGLREGAKRSRSEESNRRRSETMKGRKKSPEHARNISVGIRRIKASGGKHGRPALNPFTDREDRKLGTAPDAVVARMLGRSQGSVTGRRKTLGIPKYGS